MFFVNSPGPWQSFVLRSDNVGRPINEVTQKYLYEQLQYDNFISMQQQLEIQQYQNKGPLSETTPPFTFTFEINVGTDGDFFRFYIGTSEVGGTNVTVDWGDRSPISSGSIDPISSQSFVYNYPTAGNYIVGVTFSSPENVYYITADQND